MNDPLMLVVAGLAGTALGAFFFGGLWWTVRKGTSSRRPALWFLASLLVRTGVVMAGFYVMSGGQWRRLVAALAGFLLARAFVTRWSRGWGRRRIHPSTEAGHAP
jgi:F1F0 ATPase subunit 2